MLETIKVAAWILIFSSRILINFSDFFSIEPSAEVTTATAVH